MMAFDASGERISNHRKIVCRGFGLNNHSEKYHYSIYYTVYIILYILQASFYDTLLMH